MYFKLTYHHSADKKQVGDFFLCGAQKLDIGQTNCCELRLPESSDFEPVVFATILCKQDGKGYSIIKRTDFHELQINEKRLKICRSLKDGDLISFVIDGQIISFLFSMYNDGEYSASMGVVYKKYKPSRKIQYGIAAIAFLALFISALSMYLRRDYHILRHENLDVYDASIYHIHVDSVYLVQDSIVNGKLEEQVLEAGALDRQVAGTCFLTCDSLFVTARHCVEPWINDEDWNGISYDDKMSPAVRLATMAETRNMLSGEERYRVKAHCMISKGLEQYEYYSTDFHFNKSRDQVVCLGTDQHPIYWRTIMPLASRRDMELGDFAYVESKGLKGNLQLADMKDMKVFRRQPDKDIVAIGFPLNDNQDESICVKVFGNSQNVEFTKDDSEIAGCIQMSAPINPGNSGGPVLAKIKDRIFVIGIVSKADGQATQGTFWVIPSTEIVSLKQRGGKIIDTLIFRR